jgi:hypothetical protein
MQSVMFAGALGAAGGLLLELAELGRFLGKNGHLPWSRRGRRRVVRVEGALRRWESSNVYMFAVAMRMLVGAGVAALVSLAGPLNPLAAVVTGVGAYSVIDGWANGTDVKTGTGPPDKGSKSSIAPRGRRSAKSTNSNGPQSRATPEADSGEQDTLEETV